MMLPNFGIYRGLFLLFVTLRIKPLCLLIVVLKLLPIMSIKQEN